MWSYPAPQAWAGPSAWPLSTLVTGSAWPAPSSLLEGSQHLGPTSGAVISSTREQASPRPAQPAGLDFIEPIEGHEGFVIGYDGSWQFTANFPFALT